MDVAVLAASRSSADWPAPVTRRDSGGAAPPPARRRVTGSTSRPAPPSGSPPAGSSGAADDWPPWPAPVGAAGGALPAKNTGSSLLSISGGSWTISSAKGNGVSGATAQRGMASSGGWSREPSASVSAVAASTWDLAAASACSFAAWVAALSAASRSSRASRAFHSVASLRSARGSTRRELEEPPAGPTTEPPGPRSRESGALSSKRKKSRRMLEQEENDVEHATRQLTTYAETA